MSITVVVKSNDVRDRPPRLYSKRQSWLFGEQCRAAANLSRAPGFRKKGGRLTIAAPISSDLADPVVEFSTLVELLRSRAQRQPEQRLYSYLLDGETAGAHLTLAALDRQARAIAALLQSLDATGERALLLYPTGLDFIAAFFGCLYAGVIAVPVPPPNPAQPQRALPRLRVILDNAQPTVALTTSLIRSKLEGLLAGSPATPALRWLATDDVPSGAELEWQAPASTPDSLALLQYTSGSTSMPRGVMVSHSNLIHNSAHITRAFALTMDSVSVMWLPLFHDMGLTNGVVQPLLMGRECFLMAPQAFLQRPARWLQAISSYRATISGGPNFAYDLCTRRITPEQRENLDLSGWQAAYNGAEPVRADTLKRFTAAFAGCGFQPSFFYPCYGLAEATLLVAGGIPQDDPVLCIAEVSALEHSRVIESREAESCDPRRKMRTLVGSGRALPGTRIAIVDAELFTLCAPDVVGEIWVSSPSVARGYWNRPEETTQTFHAYLADTGVGPFLRTGDLGFLRDGELFVTGRLKDLIIIDGRNVYPQDIELTVEQSHPAMRPGGCAAFSVEIDDEERLIVAVEVDRHYRANVPPAAPRPPLGERPPLDADAITRAIRRAVAEDHDVRVHSVVLLKAGSIPRTPSGKVQRRQCQTSFINGTMEGLWGAGESREIHRQRVVASV
jgi:acyl-CoA synthetase (AMP-forming)/AMP-acid ligase II